MLAGFMTPTARGVVGTRNNCNVLLGELQQIWNEMGESEADKDRMMLEIERECLEVYQRKIDEAANAKAHLHQSVVAKEAEFATLMASLGELNLHSTIQKEKRATTLREHLASLHTLVEELKLKKEERVKEFVDLKAQIDKITAEISGYGHPIGSLYSLNLEEQDLSLRKLNDYQTHLRGLQRQKSERLQKILGFVNEVHSLCGVLGLDFLKTIGDVHPSLHGTNLEQSTNISDSTVEGLEKTITRLKTERKNRYQKLKDIVSTLSELWNLMGSTKEEKQKLSGIVSIFRASGTETLESGALSTENMEQALEEVERLTNLKASRMKELVMKKRSELEDLCRKIHVLPDPNTAPEKSSALIDSGLVDPCELMANIEAEIIRIKDEALIRKEIMDKIERWLSACDEENWLEEYNQDDNRYNAVRGAHTNLKRAERARITVTKIPAMVDSLISKTLAWEDVRKKLFHYDGVRLVSILEDYKLARLQKEHEKKRQRDQKKLQDLLMTEKEAMYGSKPSPRRSSSFRKTNGYRPNGNGSMTPTPRRNSLGSATPELLTPRSYSGRQNGYFREIRKLSTAPLNFVSIAKEDTISFSSICGSEPESPPLGSS